MTSARSSEMEKRLYGQPDELRAILSDEDAARLTRDLIGRRVLVTGTGTSWHAANHAAWFLRGSSIDAWAMQAMDAATLRAWEAADAVLILSHRNTKRFTTQIREEARAAGKPAYVIGGIGSGADLEAGAPERSAAFTGSHLCTLLRLAQIGQAAGVELGDLDAIPGAVAEALASDDAEIEAPERLVEFVGAGANQWTAAEGALKARETAYVATEGLSVEQFLHGPAVALDQRDLLIALDGGGPGSDRLREVADTAARAGVSVRVASAPGIGEPLSVFPLTAVVQKVALRLAQRLGTNPDSFRSEEKPMWREIEL